MAEPWIVPVVVYPICECDCGCEPDGEWHYTEPIGCRCTSLGCPCVVDQPGVGVGGEEPHWLGT